VKLTKKILKKLIKEELSRMTNELMLPGSPKHKEMIRSARVQAGKMGYDLDSKKDVQLFIDFLNNRIGDARTLGDKEEIPGMQATLRYLRTRLSSLSNPRQY
jgi:hypothetical protein